MSLLEEQLSDLARLAVGAELADVHLTRLCRQDPKAHYLKFLYLLARQLQPAFSVELGVSTGRGSAMLAAGHPAGQVLGVDPVRHGAYAENAGIYPNAELVEDRSDSPAVLDRVADGSVGLCFVDSVHACDYVMKEVELWTPKLIDGGVFLFDDLDWDDEMKGVMDALPFEEKGRLDELHPGFGFGYAIVRRDG